MFEPIFNYTHTIVNNLVIITSSTDTVTNAYVVPKWDVSLRREAIIQAAHASTAIEGNPLTVEEVTKLAEGREIMATRKSKQEVLNYLGVLEDIDKYQEDGRITEERLLRLHGDVSKGVLDDPKYEGRYREEEVVVKNMMTGEIIFTPPGHKMVKKLTRSLIDWLNSHIAQDLHPVLVAGICHYEFVRIHPFVDGNGRSARALPSNV